MIANIRRDIRQEFAEIRRTCAWRAMRGGQTGCSSGVHGCHTDRAPSSGAVLCTFNILRRREALGSEGLRVVASRRLRDLTEIQSRSRRVVHRQRRLRGLRLPRSTVRSTLVSVRSTCILMSPDAAPAAGEDASAGESLAALSHCATPAHIALPVAVSCRPILHSKEFYLLPRVE